MASSRKSSSLAAAAGDQVRSIIEAAEQSAAQIRSEAEEEAARIRQEAEDQATGIRSEARGDVTALVDSIQESVKRLSSDLASLQEKLAPPAPSRAPEPQAVEPVPSEPEPAGHTDADTESARLVALNMALDGASRDEVDRYLGENFELTDRGALLDDVYASIGG